MVCAEVSFDSFGGGLVGLDVECCVVNDDIEGIC